MLLNRLLMQKLAGKTFKAHGKVTLGKGSKTIDLLFECVRREEDWENRFAERMNFYKDFYNNFVPGDSGFMVIPQLILVCEDDKHMVETLREIISKNLIIDKIKLYFTTDLKQNSTTLDKSLTEFVKDEATGKYKAINIEFKVLA